MSAPVVPQLTSEQRPTPSVIDLRAAPASMDDIAKRFDIVLAQDAATLGGPPIPLQTPAVSPEAQLAPATASAAGLARLPAEPVTAADPVHPQDPTAEPVEPVELQTDPNDPQSASSEESGTPSEEDGSIRSVSQLAEFVGSNLGRAVEESELLEAIHITTADDNEIPLSTVIAGYLAQPEAAQAAEERVQLEGQFDARRVEMEGIHDEALLRVGHLAKVMHDDMIGSMPSPEEMGRLKTEEPERFAEIRLHAMEMQQRVGEAMAHLDAEYQKRGAEGDQREQEWRAGEAQKLLKIFPDLANEATRKQQEQSISSYLGGKGFKSAEIAAIYDSRMFGVVADALYGSKIRSTGSAKIAEARERGLRAPRPGPTARVEQPGQSEQKASQLVALRDRAKNTGSVDDAAAVFRGMGVD